jgi:uncharacterized membrane protein HdeD (DUF308 family)
MTSPSPPTPGEATNPILALGLAKGSKWLFWYGLFMCFAGVFAIAFPGFATLATIKILGWLLVFGGVARVVQAFSHSGGNVFLQLALGLLTLGVGGYIVFNPLSGAVAVTLLIASVFLVEGVFESVLAMQLRPAEGWTWMLVSGLISAVAGVLISLELLGTSLFLLGILVGVSFLSSGIASMILSRAVKRATETAGAAV